jgi:uncharacterized protein YegL
VLVLILAGTPTDDYRMGLQKLFSQPWGRKAIRIGIGIGEQADTVSLRAFIRNPEIPVLRANNPEDLTRFIRWASVRVNE